MIVRLSLTSQLWKTLVTMQALYKTRTLPFNPISPSLAGDKTHFLAHTMNSEAISWEKKVLGYL